MKHLIDTAQENYTEESTGRTGRKYAMRPGKHVLRIGNQDMAIMKLRIHLWWNLFEVTVYGPGFTGD